MGPTTKKKRADTNTDSDAKAKKLEKALREGRADAKMEFESQRSDIYNALSPSYKQMFGQIVFAKWKKIYLPALILSPYSVPPGPVRTMWMDKFEKLKAKNMLDQMIYLIYWYGSKSDGDFYGFVSKSNFYTYKQEAAKGAKGIHVLPAKLQEKMNDTSAKLTSSDEDMIRTYQELEEDLLKDPSDRKRGVLSFLEGYEMLSHEDLDEIDVDESSSASSSDTDDDHNDFDNDDEEKSIEAQKSKAIVKKAYMVENVANKNEKKMKYTKSVLEFDDSRPNHLFDDDPNVGKVALMMVKKRSRISIDVVDSPLLTGIAKKKKKAKKDTTNIDNMKSLSPAPLAPIIDSAAVLSDGIGENDEDDDDVDVDDKSGDDESSAEMEHDDDDKDDCDFVENVVESQQARKIKKKSVLKKVVAIKKEQKVKTKIDLPKTDKQLKRKETEEFRRCEDQYLRFIRKWEAAIKDENVDRLRRILTDADQFVGNFCYSFILNYGLSAMLKDTKQVLKKANEDLAEFVALKEKIKVTFETKRLLVPKGYVVPKRSYPPTAITESKKSEDSNIDVSDHGKIHTTMIPETIQSVEPIKSISQSNASSSTLKGIPKTGLVVRNSSGVVRPDVPTSNTAAPKLKSFLGNLMQQQHQRLSSSQSSSNIRDEAKTVALTNNLDQVPSWAKASAIEKEVMPIIPQNDDTRSLALEFLKQMAQQFPEGLVNIDAMARYLEFAIYQWVKSKTEVGSNYETSWVDRYWRKVHAIVAAFCGNKLEKGTFYTLLLQGKFDTPNKIVNVSDEKYDAAFEGKVVTI